MKTETNIIDLRRLWRAIHAVRWVALVIVVLFTGIGIWFSMRMLPSYKVSGEVLIGDEETSTSMKGGGMSQMMKTFSVGGFGGSTVDNEVLVMSSHDVMLRTVRSLGLNRSYVAKDKDGDKVMLFGNTPVRVEAPVEYFDSLNTIFNVKIDLLENGHANVRITKGMLGRVKKEFTDIAIPTMIETPYGTLNLMRNDSIPFNLYKSINVTVMGNEICSTNLTKVIDIGKADKLADVIDVDYTCANKKLGLATVNAVMHEYNAKRLERMHQSSREAIEYYDARIADVFGELQKAEQAVAEYQKKNDLMGVDSELGLLVEKAVGNKEAIATANYNIAYYENVLNILRSRLNEDALIPQVESLGDGNIAAFNELITQRRELRRSATDDNEVLHRINEKIETVRNLIIENSEKQLAKNRADVRHTASLTAEAEGRLSQYPQYEIEYRHLVTDKEYRNQLYQYLVSQRENAVLQLYSTTDIGFVFQPAYFVKSTGMVKAIVIPVALLIFGLFCSLCMAILVMLLQRKVKSTIDVASLGVEENSINYSGRESELAQLRNRLTFNPDAKAIYVADLTSKGNAASLIFDSLVAIETPCELIEGITDNNTLLTPSFAQRMSDVTGRVDYAVVDVPQPRELPTITNVIDAEEAELVVAVDGGKMSRKALKEILKGQRADHVFVVINI